MELNPLFPHTTVRFRILCAAFAEIKLRRLPLPPKVRKAQTTTHTTHPKVADTYTPNFWTTHRSLRVPTCLCCRLCRAFLQSKINSFPFTLEITRSSGQTTPQTASSARSNGSIFTTIPLSCVLS